MNKILKAITLASILFMLITSSCNISVANSPQMTETPTATVRPTETATPPAAAPTESASATPQFAPLCEADASISTPAQCQTLIAEESSVFCTNKRPFNIIFINKGNTYEALTKGFYCTDGGLKGDKQIITCTGNMASTYQVNVCDPTCIIPTVAAQITQCPQDYQFDSLRGCCTQDFIQLQQNCRVFEFKTSTCKVDCSVNTTKKACNNNSVACIWLADKKECIERE